MTQEGTPKKKSKAAAKDEKAESAKKADTADKASKGKAGKVSQKKKSSKESAVEQPESAESKDEKTVASPERSRINGKNAVEADEASMTASEDGEMNFHDADGGLEEGPLQGAEDKTRPTAEVPEEVLDGTTQGDKDEGSAETHSELRLPAKASGVEVVPDHSAAGNGVVNLEPKENGVKLDVERPRPGTADSGTSSPSLNYASSSGKRGFWNMLRTSTDAGNAQNPSTSLAPTSSSSTDFRPKLANSFSSSLSSFAAGLSAPAWAVRRDSNDPPAERKRLPRRHIDEAQLAEDVMRFADARHVLRTENDAGRLRELGLRLEEDWRKKLSEAQELRSQLEETQDTLEDLQDENEHLRTQLGTLSEQIAAREDAFEQFQKSSIEQQAREKQLWKEEAREELENALFKVAEAQRQAAQEHAVVAQLRLILQRVKSGRLDVLDNIDLPEQDAHAGTITESGKSAREALSVADDNDGTSTKADEGEKAVGANAEKGTEDIHNDVLFNLSQSPSSSRRTTIISDPKSLHEMRREGFLPDPIAEEGGTQSIAAQILFDKAAADAALTKALQEENLALRSHIEAKDRRCNTLQIETQDLQARLTQTEAAIGELLEAAAPT